jgi:hypothetical protein
MKHSSRGGLGKEAEKLELTLCARPSLSYPCIAGGRLSAFFTLYF